MATSMTLWIDSTNVAEVNEDSNARWPFTIKTETEQGYTTAEIHLSEKQAEKISEQILQRLQERDNRGVRVGAKRCHTCGKTTSEMMHNGRTYHIKCYANDGNIR